MALFLDSAGLDLAWNYLNEYITFYGVCKSDATAAYKRVFVYGLTNLKYGTKVLVKFINENRAGDSNNSVYLQVDTRNNTSTIPQTSMAIITDEYGNVLGKERAHWLRGYCEFVYSKFGESDCWALISSPAKDIVYVSANGNNPEGREGMIMFKEKETAQETT